jgi:hypothetical protein
MNRSLVRAGSATVGEAMDRDGHQGIEETAAQPSCSFLTVGDAQGRSGVRVSPPMLLRALQALATGGSGQRRRTSLNGQARAVAARYEPRRARLTPYAQNSSNSYWS